MIDTPIELKEALCRLFPEFTAELDDDGEVKFGCEMPLTYHHIWLTFGPISNKCLAQASNKAVKQFGEIINYMVASGGEKENSVSTCLLEHASQLKIIKILKPLLNTDAKAELA